MLQDLAHADRGADRRAPVVFLLPALALEDRHGDLPGAVEPSSIIAR